MKILCVTETWNQNNGPYETHYAFFKKTFEGLGHEVRAVDNKKNHLFLGGPTTWYLPRALRAFGWLKLNHLIINRLVLQTAREYRPDLILITKGENLSWRMLRRLHEESGAVIMNWNHDSPFYWMNSSMNLLRSFRHIDCFASLSRQFMPAVLTCGCPRVEHVPMFFTEERFASSSSLSEENRKKYACDLLFVGRGVPDRFEMLRALCKYDLALYGDWTQLPPGDPLQRCVRGGPLNMEEYGMALRSCKIAINVLSTQCKGANNLRTFEATGCGAFLLTEYSREQAEILFRDGEELACFRDPEELVQLAERYLEDESARQRIAAAGQKRCLAEHTLRNRLAQIVEIAEQIQREKKEGTFAPPFSLP